MLDRYLAELKNDAETVLDSLDYQKDAFECGPLQPELEYPVSPPLSPPVLFSDGRDRLSRVPFEACRTWTVSLDQEQSIPLPPSIFSNRPRKWRR